MLERTGNRTRATLTAGVGGLSHAFTTLNENRPGEAIDMHLVSGPFRKRQEDAQKDREKDEKSEQEAAARKENCSRAQEQLRQAESGQRIARTDAKGDRYFLDESQLAQETSRLRGIVEKSCN